MRVSDVKLCKCILMLSMTRANVMRISEECEVNCNIISSSKIM